MDADRRITHSAERRFGLITRPEAIAAGLDTNAIAYRLRTGRWRRTARGVYAIAGVRRTFEQDVLTAVLATGGSASHRTAAWLWRLVDVEPRNVEVTVESHRCVKQDGVLVHRSRSLETGDVTVIGAVRVTTPARTLVDLASVVDAEVLEEILDESIRRRLVTPAKVLRRIEGLAARGSRGIGDLRALALDRVRTGASDSRLETRLRRLLRNARLPAPVPQLEVRDNGGRLLGRVDFAYADQRLAIEVDGYTFHSGRRRWQADRARHNRLTTAGWTVCYFTHEDLRERPGDVVEQIRRAMR